MKQDAKTRAKAAAAKAVAASSKQTAATRRRPAMAGGSQEGGDGQPPKRNWEVVLERFSDIKPEEMTWLWEPVWLDHSLNLLTGNPGLGKTFIAAHLTACVSAGLSWPQGGGKAPKGDVVFMSTEDSYSQVLVHRVAAAGGDLTRVHRWTCKKYLHEDGEERTAEISLEDIDIITPAIEKVENLKLVIFDPVTSYLGTADANDNAEVRRVLNKLVALAEEKKFAVLLITHDKKMNVAAINSAMGSTAFTALPRVVQGLYRDPEDDSKMKRILCPIKNNHGDDRASRTFRIEIPNGKRSKSHIVWDEQTDERTADEIKAMAMKSLASVGKEHSDEETSKRRQVKICMILDLSDPQDDGWVSLSTLRENSGMSSSTLNATIFEMIQLGILEENRVDRDLPKGGRLPGGQRVVRRKRHVF